MARPNLNDPKLAVVVLVVLAVVAGINLKTYVFDRAGADLPERVARNLEPPADLATILEESLGSDLLSVVVEQADGIAARAVRDPFSRSATATAPTGPRRSAPARARTAGPVCTAVILDAAAPYALIEGRRCGVGDRVAGYRVVGIDMEGARLIDARGLERTLPVRPRTGGAGFEITFETRHDTRPAHPDVATDPDTERRER